MLQAGQTSMAEDLLRQTLDTLPRSSYAPTWLAYVYERTNRPAEAARTYEATAPNFVAGRPRLYATLALLHDAAGNLNGSIAALSESVRLSPNDAVAHTMLGRAYTAQDRSEQALVEYAGALLVDRQSLEAQLGVGRLHIDAGRHEEAVLVLRPLVNRQPGFVEARYALATALFRSGSTDEGNRELAEFERLQVQRLEEARRSTVLASIKEEANLRAAEGAFERAVALWRQVIELEPRLASNRISLAVALVSTGELEIAAQQYEMALTLGTSIGVYHQLARIYEQLGRPEDKARAIARFEEAVSARIAKAGLP
jgi:tetratricopeptide (TPR) repeat protein